MGGVATREARAHPAQEPASARCAVCVWTGGGTHETNLRKFTSLAQVHRNMGASIRHQKGAQRCVRVHCGGEADLASGMQEVRRLPNRSLSQSRMRLRRRICVLVPSSLVRGPG